MTDTTQGQDLPDDNALFQDATSTETLEKFENPELPLDLPEQTKPSLRCRTYAEKPPEKVEPPRTRPMSPRGVCARKPRPGGRPSVATRNCRLNCGAATATATAAGPGHLRKSFGVRPAAVHALSGKDPRRLADAA